MDDDATREYAVRALGEDAVRALEVEVVKAHRDRLSPGTFAGHDVGAAQIREGAAATRESSTPVARHATYELELEARRRSAGMWSACR